jgi:CRP-like cAMP-binding protein
MDNPLINFDPSMVEFLTTKLEAKIHMPEDQIITQGEAGRHIYFIANGQCEVSVRDHNSISEIVRIIGKGELFGEIALLCGCKRTASVKTSNYSTIACIDKDTFKDMCRQYNDLSLRMKVNMKKYQDKLKIFLKIIIRGVPYFNDLSEDSIEEITYHLRQKYIEPDEIIFRAGDPVDYLRIITKGEVDLITRVENHDLVVHNLYQGCHTGGYKVLDDFVHSHTARAVNSVTLHYITKDSILSLINNVPEIKASIEKAKYYMENSQVPIVGFGLFRDPKGNISSIQILKMAVVKILKLGQDLK